MGIYLVSVAADDWAEEEVGGALDEELGRRGLPAYRPPEPVKFVPHSGTQFEEKLYRPMEGVLKLCEAQPDAEECVAALLDWALLIPVPVEETIVLPVEASYTDTTPVCGAERSLRAARRLAAAIGLPPQVPEHCDNLDIGVWFDDAAAVDAAAATHPGSWRADLDTAFYVSMYLRAAEHCLRTGNAIMYC
jgi:hypothetical protein